VAEHPGCRGCSSANYSGRGRPCPSKWCRP
jgi:hypothetical protein